MNLAASANARAQEDRGDRLVHRRTRRGRLALLRDRTDTVVTRGASSLSTNRNPRSSQLSRSAAVLYPPGATYTNPRSGRPVKSIGRTCRCFITRVTSSAITRTTRSVPVTPHMRPPHRNVKPPNIFFSVTSERTPSTFRMRSASSSSYATKNPRPTDDRASAYCDGGHGAP